MLAAVTRRWEGFRLRAEGAAYSPVEYVLFFFTFAGAGWLWEVLFTLAQTGELVNRGTLHGPWLPIYGVGGVLALLLLRRLAGRPWLVFGVAAALCTGIEYGTSVALERATGLRWWDYSGWFLNVEGRVCLAGTVAFGGACCAVIYLLAPALARLFRRLPWQGVALGTAVLAALFTADLIFSAQFLNIPAGPSPF